MERAVRDGRIDSRTARARLVAAREPYWRKIAKGCYLGYRRGQDGGSWIGRYRDPASRQHFRRLGAADDVLEADGLVALSFEQAQEKARQWFQDEASRIARGRPAGAYTVAQCMKDYLGWARVHRKSASHMETYANAFILPHLGKLDTAALTAPVLRRWHAHLADEPPRLRTMKGRGPRYREVAGDPAEAKRKRQLKANRQLTLLRAALNRAWRDGLIATGRDEWMRVEPFKGVERQRDNYLSRDEAVRLINACPSDLRALVQLALLTGARYGELCSFRIVVSGGAGDGAAGRQMRRGMGPPPWFARVREPIPPNYDRSGERMGSFMPRL